MTDRHPDDLYDALRDRLADYGQEPPAPLWANIRAQLPPPVAVPQLRRRRRWSPVLLLGLLVAVVGGTYWLWRHKAATSPLASRTSAAHSPAARLNQPPSMAANEAEMASSTPTPPNAGRTTEPQATTSSTSSIPAAPARNPASATIPPGTYAANTVPAAASAHAAVTPAGARSANGKPEVRAGRNQPAVRLLAGQPGAKSRKGSFDAATVPTDRAKARSKRSKGSLTVENVAFALKTDVRDNAGRRAVQTAAGAYSTPAGSLATRPALPDAGAMAKSKPNVKPVENTDRDDSAKVTMAQRGLPMATISPAANEPAAVGFSAATPVQTTRLAAIGRAENSLVALQLIPVPEPFVRPQPDSLYLPKVLARHWALLVLAGPALTHRRLGGSTLDQVLAPSSTLGLPSRNTKDSALTRQLAQRERQSTGFGVQVQVSRVLDGRWTISAGLGYQQYASTAEITQTFPNRLMPTSTSTLTHRDTYRFLTVPVQVHYALGQAGKRLRYGLVAGAEAAIYLSGRNLQPNGTIKDWNTSSSPYRSLSLALSTGLDVRYRLAPRLEMVAQPTATYFLNPLARPATGLPPRYLWGGSALLGLSYHLR